MRPETLGRIAGVLIAALAVAAYVGPAWVAALAVLTAALFGYGHGLEDGRTDR